MKLRSRHALISPAEWRKLQQSGKDLPHEVMAPKDVCSRCKTTGEMRYTTGHPLCEHCAEQTRFQPPAGSEEASIPAYVARRKGIYGALNR